ncbi:ABC transporter ATP-binding protein [Vandammella animalimorsus]|uniref:ABC transporter ATP-binding protein n=1 Tax=Vandammella animalimorsus TaxID=2029117 RepID=UPI001EEF45F1|nr:ABC transporter ATP-binding protein [Vandammella animalimorsus]
MALIEIDQLVFEYPGHRALDGVSLRLERGSVTALVGPNGAGKSTLLRCMAGLETPLSGQIRIDGISVIDAPRQVHRKLGYLSDFFGLYEGLRVRQCLAYAALAVGVARQQLPGRVAQVAQAMDLTALLQRRPGELSRGQRQRLAIGQAIIHSPQVLLLDEPASGLDPQARSSLAALFRQLQAQGMTLLVSSHILSELDEYSTHILSIRQGRIVSHEDLRASPHWPQPAGPDAPAAADAPQRQQRDPHLYPHLLELACAPDEEQALQARLEAAWAQLPHSQGLPPPARHASASPPSVLPPSPAGQAHWVPNGAEPAASLQWQLWLPAAATARAQLVQQLVAAGLPVAGLWPLRLRLQERYARSLQTEPPSPWPTEQPPHAGERP